MFLRIFKSNMPIVIFLISLLALGLWLKSFFDIPPREFTFDLVQMPLYKVLKNILGNNWILRVISGLLFTLLLSFSLVRLNTKYFFINKRSYLPSLLFILIASSLHALNRLNPVIIAAFFLVIALDRIIGTYRQDGLSYNYFEASFSISFGSLFYLNLAAFLPITWIGLILFRPFKWREWLFTLIGFALPYIFLISYYYLVDKNLVHRVTNIYNNFKVTNGRYYLKDEYFLFLGYLGLLMILASNHIIKNFPKKKIHARNSFILLLWVFIISLIAFFVLPSASLELLIISSIPLSYLITNYFLFMKSKRWSEIFFFMLLALVLLVQTI